jgi:3-oxoacyl-[acyl-carrier-protein] synthase III
MNKTINTVLRGTGSYLPERVVINDEYSATLDTSDEWIRTRTGIRERRFVHQDESCSTMAIQAAKAALRISELSPSEIDVIICATVTPDYMTPATANLIQGGLGCRTIPSFDLTAACTGFLYALSVGDQFIRSGSAKNVLVVGSEVLSRVIDFSDRNTVILFGDGAGAAILSASSTPNRGLHSARLYSDSTNAHLVRVPSMATQTRPGEKPIQYLEMNGREIFRFAVSKMTELINQAQIDASERGAKIDLIIPHQVNQRIIYSAMETIGFPTDKVMINLNRYGNTSAASVPIAIDEALRTGRAKPGDTLLLVAFGGGLTWGSIMITL